MRLAHCDAGEVEEVACERAPPTWDIVLEPSAQQEHDGVAMVRQQRPQTEFGELGNSALSLAHCFHPLLRFSYFSRVHAQIRSVKATASLGVNARSRFTYDRRSQSNFVVIR